MPVFDAAVLQGFVTRLWTALGVPEADAETVSAALVEANLCGHDSHGVIRLQQWIEHLQDGRLSPGAPVTVVAQTAATAVVDGGWNFGAVVGRRAVALGVDKALAAGVGAVAIRRSHHLGRLADHCRQAAEAGCLSQLTANNHGPAAAVAPWGGRERRLSTNPIAFGLPRREAPPILVDVTTAVAAEGKVRVLRNRGEQAPSGWLLDAEGRPTRDPAVFYADPPGSLLPLGGDVGHKGYGLSVAVDLFSGALSGGGCTTVTPPKIYGNAACLTVWDPAAFGPAEEYYDQVEAFVASLRSSPTQPGVSEILLPGEPEQRTRAKRLETGIPVDETTWSAIVSMAEEAGVPVPSERGAGDQ